jgi:hypothetical protein
LLHPRGLLPRGFFEPLGNRSGILRSGARLLVCGQCPVSSRVLLHWWSSGGMPCGPFRVQRRGDEFHLHRNLHTRVLLPTRVDGCHPGGLWRSCVLLPFGKCADGWFHGWPRALIPSLNTALCCAMQGSQSRLTVSTGYFSTPSTGPEDRRWGQLPCPTGSYCSGGLQSPCPPGRYGSVSAMFSPSCSGLCASGWYCTGAATSAQQFPCGIGIAAPDSVYCPLGSVGPVAAQPGEYTSGGTSTTRLQAEPCTSGSYCANGTSRPCPAGLFGCASHLSSNACNGLCTPGFYCPLGSVSSQAYVVLLARA